MGKSKKGNKDGAQVKYNWTMCVCVELVMAEILPSIFVGGNLCQPDLLYTEYLCIDLFIRAKRVWRERKVSLSCL